MLRTKCFVEPYNLQCAISTLPGDACVVCGNAQGEGATAILSPLSQWPWEAYLVAEGVPAIWGAIQASPSSMFSTFPWWQFAERVQRFASPVMKEAPRTKRAKHVTLVCQQQFICFMYIPLNLLQFHLAHLPPLRSHLSQHLLKTS